MSVAGNDFSVSNSAKAKEPLLSDQSIEQQYEQACLHAEESACDNLIEFDDAELCMDMWAGMYENSVTSLGHLEKKEVSEHVLTEAVRELAYARTYARFINEMNGEGEFNKGHEGLTEVFANIGKMKATVQPLTTDTLPKVLSDNLLGDQQINLMKLDNKLNDIVGISETGRSPEMSK